MVAAFGGWNDAGGIGVERGRLPGREPRRAPGGGDRPRGVLRLPGDPPAGRPDHGRATPRSSGPRWRSSPPAPPTPPTTSCWSRAPSRRSAGGPSARRSSTPPTPSGCTRVVTLGSLLADVVHTRPVRLTGMASDEALIADLDFRTPSYAGPTGIVGVLHQRGHRARPRGRLAVGAGLALRGRASPTPRAPSPCCAPSSASAGVELDLDELETRRAHLRDPGRRARSRPSRACARSWSSSSRPPSEGREGDYGPLPTGDELAEELERFLRERDEPA